MDPPNFVGHICEQPHTRGATVQKKNCSNIQRGQKGLTFLEQSLKPSAGARDMTMTNGGALVMENVKPNYLFRENEKKICWPGPMIHPEYRLQLIGFG